MGTDSAGEKIKDHIKRMAPLLQDKSISAKDKLRLILLYIINKGGARLRADIVHDRFLTDALRPGEERGGTKVNCPLTNFRLAASFCWNTFF